jgi:hypothetical protein
MPASKAQQAATADRRKKAIALKLAGLDYQSIADQLGYADRAAAWIDIDRALKKNLREEAEAADTLRHVEIQRLDRLQAALWPKAIKGDTKAADTTLRIITARCKLEGVEPPTQIALEHRLDMEGELVAAALSAALDALGLDHDQRVKALGVAQQHLLGAGSDATAPDSE